MSSLSNHLRAVMALDPERPEIDFDGREFTWARIATAVGEIEAALGQLDLPADARIGVMLRNRPGHVAAILAVLSGQRCLVSLNPMLPDAQLAEDLRRLQLAVVVADETDALRPGLAEILDQLGCAFVIIGSLLEPVHMQSSSQELPSAASTAPGVAIEMLTSGTTGKPKRVPLSRAAFEESLVGFVRYERGRKSGEPPKLRSGVTLVTNPLTHIGGIYGCIASLLAGRKIALLERFTVEGWVSAVRRNRPKVAPAVPSALRMLLEANLDPDDLSSLSALISGTAPLSPELVDAFLERYGLPVLGNYGATEFAGAVAGWGLDDFRANWTAKRGSAGRLHSNVAARIVDPASGEELPRGEEGLLELKGDQLGYANRLEGGDWLRTTDRAVVDDDNFLFIRGRADNAIIRGGFKVHPDDVVNALQAHPAVLEAAVCGVKDTRLGQVPVAAIILRQGSATPSIDELKIFLRTRLLPYQVPVEIRMVEDFPRTPSMKPSTPGLQALFSQ